MFKTQLKKYLPWLLAAIGVVLMGYLIRKIGVDNLLNAVKNAWVFLPFIVFLDITWQLGEVLSYRCIIGKEVKRIPIKECIRMQMAAYAVLTLVPTGRIGAEVARAALIRKYLSYGTTGAAATLTQAVSLFANAVVSILCVVAVWHMAGEWSTLAWLVLGNAGICTIGGLAIIVISRKSKIGERLTRWIPALGTSIQSMDEAMQVPVSRLLKAGSYCLAARLGQTLQYGLMFAAVGGPIGLTPAFVSQGIHLVSAAMGDIIPNGVGIMEAIYTANAASLGFADAPERAIAIPLLARASQVVMLTLAFSGIAILRRGTRAAADSSATSESIGSSSNKEE